MPYTRRQLQTAEAVKHGFQPIGKASSFSKAFADYVLSEEPKVGMRKPVKKKGKR